MNNHQLRLLANALIAAGEAIRYGKTTVELDPVEATPDTPAATPPPPKVIQQPVQQPTYPPMQVGAQQPVQQPTYPPMQVDAQQPVQQPVQQPTYPPMQVDAQQPAQQPVQQPAQQPAQQPVQVDYTLGQVHEVLGRFASTMTKEQEALMVGAIQACGANKVSELDPSRYGELISRVEAIANG